MFDRLVRTRRDDVCVEMADLEGFLRDGLSLEEIGRRAQRHPSTVAYWLGKYDLEAVNRELHAARGGIGREILEQLIDERLSIRAIADRLGVSYSTVRYWLRRHELNPAASRRQQTAREARAAGIKRIQLVCSKHGLADFTLEGRQYYRCARCRAEHVSNRRRRVKAQLVEQAGGCCHLCGYDGVPGALHFHHLNPLEKSFHLSHRGVARALEKAQAEAAKCVLLCANCHAEVEAGLASVD